MRSDQSLNAGNAGNTLDERWLPIVLYHDSFRWFRNILKLLNATQAKIITFIIF